VNRYAALYLVTLFVIVPLDFLFLGVVAKDFFTPRSATCWARSSSTAILFYLLYVVGTVVFVSGGQGATWQSTLLYGALFGFFCYATFDLTSLALLKHWSWPVAIVDITWGALATAVSSTAGLLVANWVAPKI
jgi:Predicted membrane protein